MLEMEISDKFSWVMNDYIRHDISPHRSCGFSSGQDAFGRSN
jgi:hypothetical protein